MRRGKTEPSGRPGPSGQDPAHATATAEDNGKRKGIVPLSRFLYGGGRLKFNNKMLTRLLTPVVAVAFVIFSKNVFFSDFSTYLLSSPSLRVDSGLDGGRSGGGDSGLGGVPGSPMLVLHIGPAKTASSTIQCALTRYREQLYKGASVAYLGRAYSHCKMGNDRVGELNFDTRDLMSACFEINSPPPSLCKKNKIWKMLNGQLKHFSSRNESVVLSDEAFARMVLLVDNESGFDNRRMLYELFDKYFPGRVRIVLVYRRYFELLVSTWNEREKPYKNYITNENNPYNVVYKKWPSEGGRTSITFLEYMTKESARSKLHPVERLRSVWTDGQVMILNMHEMQNDGEGIATRFVREILPPLAGDIFAKAADKDSGFAGRPNLMRNIDFDRLAVAAHQQGLLAATTPRHKVTEMAEKYLLARLNTTIGRLPQVCPDETQLQQLLNNSLEYERRIYPKRWSEEASGEHQSAFSKAKGQGKFCNLDTDKLIKENAVQKFFSTDVMLLLGKEMEKGAV